MANYDDKSNAKYMHKSYSEMNAFLAKVYSECMLYKDDPNVRKLAKGLTIDTTEDKDFADEIIHALLVKNIGCHTLLTTLHSKEYRGQGQKSIKHIKDSFSAEDDDSKQEAQETRYKTLVSTPLTNKITRNKFNSIRAELTSIVDELRDVVGPRDPEVAKALRPESLRALFGVDKQRNAAHCTDLADDGSLEVEFFFHLPRKHAPIEVAA